MGEPTVIPDALADWKAKARAGQAPQGVSLYKQYLPDSVKAVEGAERKVAFIISTGAIDRERDTLKSDGWQLDNYRKNPVVLWAHDRWGLPIARAEKIGVSGGALKATAEFVDGALNPLAEAVLGMLKGGFLRATSVGFLPIKYLINEERMGVDFEQQELLEFSVVPVPANPEALLAAKSAGIELAPVTSWCEQYLAQAMPGSILVSRETVEAGLKALAEPRVAGFDPGPFLAEFQKRGRVLSTANEERIREARTAADAVAVALDEVLGSLPPAEEPDTGGKSAPVLFVAPSPVSNLEVDPNVVRAAVQAAVSEAVRAEVNFARGRLD